MIKKFIVKNINDLDEVSSKILEHNNKYKKFAFLVIWVLEKQLLLNHY